MNAGGITAIIFLAFCVPLCFQEAVTGESIEEILLHEGIIAGESSDYETARIKFLDSGEPLALYYLGLIFFQGLGVEKDLEKSIDFYERAGDRGIAAGYFDIGAIYDKGINVEVDYAKAKRYYEKAISLGSSDAAFNLGLMYKDGKGEEVDFEKAVHYLSLSTQSANPQAMYALAEIYAEKDWATSYNMLVSAADLDHHPSLYSVGIFHFEGIGMDVNKDKAQEYIRRAAELGNAHALLVLAREYNDADSAYKLALMSLKGKPPMKARNITLAVEYFVLAASLGNADAFFTLGLFHHKEQVLPKNITNAVDYYTRALNINPTHMEANYNLGMIYLTGEGDIAQDYSKAQTLFAAAPNHPDALFQLGVIYDYGLGVDASKELGLAYYKKAATFGHLQALINLGATYEMDGDYEEAKKFYQIAADAGDARAIFSMGKLYHSGRGFPAPDYDQALKHYEIALKAGVQEAAQGIALIQRQSQS